jgi:hypothetical protein
MSSHCADAVFGTMALTKMATPAMTMSRKMGWDARRMRSSR